MNYSIKLVLTFVKVPLLVQIESGKLGMGFRINQRSFVEPDSVLDHTAIRRQKLLPPPGS